MSTAAMTRPETMLMGVRESIVDRQLVRSVHRDALDANGSVTHTVLRVMFGASERFVSRLLVGRLC